MTQKFDKHVLKNGMVILGEPMETTGSVAFGFMLPAGSATLPEGCCGAANVISDWIFRGAGDRDNKQMSDALDALGLHRNTSVGTNHLALGAALETGNLHQAIDLYGDIICRPKLKDKHFEPVRQLALDSVRSLDDDPRQKVMLKLQESFYPQPLGRSTHGRIEELENLTPEKTRQIIERRFDPSKMIFAVAGKYDFDKLCDQLERIFGQMKPKNSENIELGDTGPKYTHLPYQGAQVHIGMMCETVKPMDPNFYNARLAISILSGGMSSRLFTEVREKRGLCYAVGAKYHGLKQAAGMMCYAGTTPDKAQQTLDVIKEQLAKVSKGLTEQELNRAKAGLKSSLIMQSESSSSRVSSIAKDYYILGRIRPLEEIKQNIEQTSVDSVVEFLRNNPFGNYTVVTIGQQKVNVG